jgi:uncharacterized protein (DUF2342 family)
MVPESDDVQRKLHARRSRGSIKNTAIRTILDSKQQLEKPALALEWTVIPEGMDTIQ